MKEPIVQIAGLLCAPRIAGLLTERVPSSVKPSTISGFNDCVIGLPSDIQNKLLEAATKLIEAATSYITNEKSNIDFLYAKTAFVGHVQALKNDRQSIIGEAPHNYRFVLTRTLPTPEEIDFDIKTTFHRCHNFFQDTKHPQSALAREFGSWLSKI